MVTAFWEELPAVVETINRLAAGRVIILCADGAHFTAGIDKQIFTHMLDTYADHPARRAEQFRLGLLELHRAFNVLEHVRMPVISAVQGACIGGGIDLICPTDMRFCTDDAVFTIKETELGITADIGTLQRLQYLMPSGLARELAYTRRRMNAAEAVSYGFINQSYKDHTALLAAVRDVARQIAQHSPMAVTGTKTMLNYSRDHGLMDSLNHVATRQAGMLQAEDLREALQAHAEKRQPVFQGLSPHRSAIK